MTTFPQPSVINLDTLRTTAELTGSYVVFKTFESIEEQRQCKTSSHLAVYWDFTKATSTSMEMKAEYSQDGVTWYPDTSESVSSGAGTISTHYLTTTTTGGGMYTFPCNAQYMRLSAKCTGTATSTDLIVTGSFLYKF